MERAHSELFSPYRSIGIVTGDVSPSVRTTFVGKKSALSVLCPVDNCILQYSGSKLKPIGASNSLIGKISAVASSSSCVYAAHNNTISALPFCRNVTDSMEVPNNIKIMTLIGNFLIAIDVKSGIHVIDTKNELQNLLSMEGGDFEITAIVHPTTYINKIVVGSSAGKIRIINFRTGKVVHEFDRTFQSAITVMTQSTALDVIAVGLQSGKILLYNLKLDRVLHTFKHDAAICSIAFRDDGNSSMVTADVNGTVAIWKLCTQELIGKITDVHSSTISCLYFVPGEPIMLSASHDNSLRLWIFDNIDGMPRELVRLDGHSLAATCVRFLGKNQLLSAGEDGSIRKYDVSSFSMRQKIGSVVTKSSIHASSNTARNIVQIEVGWQRESAWSNVFCRQRNEPIITTWKTRDNSKGDFLVEHDRFRKNVEFVDASATAVCLSPCGNNVFVGYSTGHIDKFNAQSGRYILSFNAQKKKTQKVQRKVNSKVKPSSNSKLIDQPAMQSGVTSLIVDKRGKELMSTDELGCITFWCLSSNQIIAKLSKPEAKLGISSACRVNSLAAVSCCVGEVSSVVIVDTICHNIVRGFENVGKTVNDVIFSADGKWLLIADNECYIRVFDVSTANLIDVILFSKPCISMSFNETGQYLATVHAGERALSIWTNKALFLPHVNIRALDPLALPTWSSKGDTPSVCIDDDDDFIMDDEVRARREKQIDNCSITFSGLPSSRWANLPDLEMIKDRNKPLMAPKKIKQAPFFLSAVPTVQGFDFLTTDTFSNGSDAQDCQSKRELLELESTFSAHLKRTKSTDDLLRSFEILQNMSLSSIDFQIRSLNETSMIIFLRMLHTVIQTKRNFELTQAYLTTVLKVHRNVAWRRDAVDGVDEILSVCEDLLHAQEEVWKGLDSAFVENLSVVQWIKNALL